VRQISCEQRHSKIFLQTLATSYVLACRLGCTAASTSRYREQQKTTCDQCESTQVSRMHHSTATWRQYLTSLQLISSTIPITCTSSNSVVGCCPPTCEVRLLVSIMSPLEIYFSLLLCPLPMGSFSEINRYHCYCCMAWSIVGSQH
jgi:hypothetical protein